MTQNLPPMDWYPDPADATRERYWDGQQWTHNTRAPKARPAGVTRDPWAAQAPEGATPTAQQGGGPSSDPWGDQGSTAARPQQPFPVQQQNPYASQPQGSPYGAQPGTGLGTQPNGYPGTPYAGSLLVARPATADGVPLSGWWSRVWAFLIDIVLTSVVGCLLGWTWVHALLSAFGRLWDYAMAQARAGVATPTITPDMLQQYGFNTSNLAALGGIFAAVHLVYFTGLWVARGATLGQSVAGIRVVPADQGTARRIDPLRAIPRALVIIGMPWLPVYLAFVPLVNYLLPLFTRRRQALHDMIGRTQVVRSR